MVLKYNFKGLIAPVFTPYNASSEDLNLEYIPKYAEYLKTKNVFGVLVNGTTGEHVLMNTSERKTITQTWAKAAKQFNLNLMVQVGGASLPDVLDMAKHAESLNVSSILCLPDLFFKPRTVQELIHYLKLVSNAAPNTPLFYYHIPAFSGVNLSMSEFLKAGGNEIKTLSGIKYTCNDLDEGARCLKVDDDYTIFLGADTIYLGAVAQGFDSAIMTTLNFWPEDFQSISSLIKEGRIEEAKSIQSRINKKIENILAGGNWVVKMKNYMLHTLGFPVGPSRIVWQD
uniref:N-acetylneuraminate lyase n=1 Tax=Riptortus pedestris TaxID=329032 RepID=R4WNH6_RIPPE|nr:unkown protein [Riptortus pedestris]